MLKRLSIRNYALITRLDIEFSGKMNIITGETGAGKSIIIGALSMILGERADSKVLFNPSEKCIIEGTFDISSYSLKDFFIENNLDFDTLTTLRREITSDGKSRAFINDTPVNLVTLKILTENLVDVHSQYETLDLNQRTFQLMAVDALCDHDRLLEEYQQAYKAYKKEQAKLEELEAQSNKAKTDLDYFQFQFNELEDARLTEGEQEGLERELQTLTHAEEIKRNLSSATYLLADSERSATTQVKDVLSSLAAIEKYHTQIGSLIERLKSSLIELKDIASEIETIEQTTTVNEQRAIELNSRLNTIYHLQQKHRVATMGELIALKDELTTKLNSILFLDDDIKKQQELLSELKKRLILSAHQLSDKRNKAIPRFEEQVKTLLAEVAMEQALLRIENNVFNDENFGPDGIDHIRFYFAANKGSQLQELNKVASGGELSRLMLCIKSLIAKHTALPTIIFDEIDTGISGEVALKVGTIMEKLASSLQVISITHLPQIAGKGDAHYFVYKETRGEKTYTNIKRLTQEERILEIAKMLSGETPSEFALQNARELIHSN